MSTKAGKKAGAGIWFLPLAIAAPVAAGMAVVLYRVWPTIHKLFSILVKMVVKA